MFTNWLKLRKVILGLQNESRELVVDLSDAKLVDHTVMKKLEEMERDWSLAGKKLRVTGLNGHRRLSDHPHAARASRPQPFPDKHAPFHLWRSGHVDRGMHDSCGG